MSLYRTLTHAVLPRLARQIDGALRHRRHLLDTAAMALSPAFPQLVVQWQRIPVEKSGNIRCPLDADRNGRYRWTLGRGPESVLDEGQAARLA